MRLNRRQRRLGPRIAAGVVAVGLIATTVGCSGSDSGASAFCEKLGEVTGSGGVEASLQPGDPARIDGVVVELTELHARAPEEISATTRALLTFFRSYQQAARDERRDVIAENEQVISTASAELERYALEECGLLLQRTVPTPRPTVDDTETAPITD